jgi:hypothetical protein
MGQGGIDTTASTPAESGRPGALRQVCHPEFNEEITVIAGGDIAITCDDLLHDFTIVFRRARSRRPGDTEEGGLRAEEPVATCYHRVRPCAAGRHPGRRSGAWHRPGPSRPKRELDRPQAVPAGAAVGPRRVIIA